MAGLGVATALAPAIGQVVKEGIDYISGDNNSSSKNRRRQRVRRAAPRGSRARRNTKSRARKTNIMYAF